MQYFRFCSKMHKFFHLMYLISSYQLLLSTTAFGETIIHDGWYRMQVGSTPWGYYHEIIAKKEKKYLYRYDMVKKEGGQIYRENIGGIAEADLTPVAFNLNKFNESLKGKETISARFLPGANSGTFTIDFKGTAGERSLIRRVSNKTILEIFFPVYIHLHWKELTPKKSGSLSVLTEDSDANDYIVKNVRFEAREEKAINGRNCRVFNIELDQRKSIWCLDSNGGLASMEIESAGIKVTRVSSEAEAKSGF